MYNNDVLIDSLRKLKLMNFRVFPHIVIGLNPRGKGLEYKAIDSLTTLNIDGLSIVVFTPINGTPLEYRSYPDKEFVMRILRYAGKMISKPLVLGCMRPREWIDIEEYAFKLGYNAIANPSMRFVEKHKDLEVYNLCCSYVTIKLILVLD